MKRYLGLALAAAFVACVDMPRPVGITADAVAEAGDPPPVQYQWIPLDTRGDGFRSGALAINKGGKVVGWATTTDQSAAHAVLWEDGTMQDLGTLGGTVGEATAINERGQVAGWSTTATGAVDAFLWDNGSMQDLGPLDLRQINVGTYPILWSPVHLSARDQVVGNRPGGTFLGG